MTMLVETLAAVAAGTVLATSAFAQSAREVRGPSPYVAIEHEPAPRLIVDPPLPDQLARGVVQIQYRVENVHILPVFGAGALSVSPRVGHLHITVDDLPWHWADTSDNNTIDVVGLPPGQHKVLIELVNPAHHVFTGQTVTFTVPGLVKWLTRAGPQRRGCPVGFDDLRSMACRRDRTRFSSSSSTPATRPRTGGSSRSGFPGGSRPPASTSPHAATPLSAEPAWKEHVC